MADEQKALGTFKHKRVEVEFVLACVGEVVSSNVREKLRQTVSAGGASVSVRDGQGRVSVPSTRVTTTSTSAQQVWIRPLDGGPDVSFDHEGDPVPLAEGQTVALVDGVLSDNGDGWAEGATSAEGVVRHLLLRNESARKTSVLSGAHDAKRLIKARASFKGKAIAAAVTLGYCALIAPFALIGAPPNSLFLGFGVLALLGWRIRVAIARYGGASWAFDRYMETEAPNIAAAAMGQER